MAITVQEAQVIFSADGLTQVKSQAGLAGRALDKTTSAASGLIGKLRGVGSALSGIGGMIAGLGAGAAATWMMKLAAGSEQTAIAFEVLLGSASKSKEMIDAMRALDMKTVFGFRELGDAAKMMLNYGVAAESVVPMLSVISDIASGDAMKLEGLSRAFGQMSATGRLMGQDLNQMINAGFNPLKEISDRTGVSMAVLKKQMEAGQISAEMVAKAFESATQAGGRFHGMNDRMSQTTAGQFAKLKSNVELLAIEIGTVLLPEANKIIEWAMKLMTSVDGVGTSFKTMVTTVKTWYQNVSDNLADIGVVIGTVAGHIGAVWGGLWEDMRSQAQAFFDWFTSNATVMADNIAIHWRNAKRIMTGTTTETVAMRDEWGKAVNVTRSTLEPDRQFRPFVSPELKGGPGNGPLWKQIQDELETARKIRQEGRNAENQKDEGAKKKGIDETSVPSGLRGGAEQAAIQSEGRSKTMSAEALFGSLREGALNKQLGLMTQGINLQQQQLAAANQLVAGVNNLNLGLA